MRRVPPGWKKLAAGGALVVVLVLAGATWWASVGGLKLALESQKLRVMVGQKTAGVLNAPSGYRPFVAQGDTLRSEGLVARGAPPTPLTVLEAHDLQVRGRWLAGLWHRTIYLEELRVRSLQAAYGAGGAKLLPPGSPLAPSPPLETATNSPSIVRVDIDRVNVAHADVAWGGDAAAAGAILGTRAETVTEGAGAVRVMLAGGSFRQSGLPVLTLEAAKARFARPVLRVEEATLRLPFAAHRADPRDQADKDDGTDAASDEKPDDGRITLAGEVRFEGETPLEVRLRFAQCPVGPLLPEAWRERLLGGRFDGSATVNRNLSNEKAPPKAKGTIDARAGTLHGMRMLKQIALITGREEFGRLRLRQVHGEFSGCCGHSMTWLIDCPHSIALPNAKVAERF